jgi:hypothetical protein
MQLREAAFIALWRLSRAVLTPLGADAWYSSTVKKIKNGDSDPPV